MFHNMLYRAISDVIGLALNVAIFLREAGVWVAFLS